jgi:hypothetical protein
MTGGSTNQSRFGVGELAFRVLCIGENFGGGNIGG